MALLVSTAIVRLCFCKNEIDLAFRGDRQLRVSPLHDLRLAQGGPRARPGTQGIGGSAGLPEHKAKAITQYVAGLNGKLTLHYLPGYAPDLNPDELVRKVTP